MVKIFYKELLYQKTVRSVKKSMIYLFLLFLDECEVIRVIVHMHNYISCYNKIFLK